MRWRLRRTLLSGLILAACASSDPQTEPPTPPSATSNTSTTNVSVESSETAAPTTTTAGVPVSRSIPAPDISADLEQPLCQDLFSLLDGLVQAPLVPVGARTVGDPNGACEILYGIPPQSPLVIVGRIPKPTSGHNPYQTSQRTKDGDETSVQWDTGSITFIDPTGRDLLNLSTDASVIVDRVDGSRLYVATYDQPDKLLAVAIAQELDNRLG